MFAKTLSFWRQMVGQPVSTPAAGKDTHEDRRLWKRYLADLEGWVQLADGHEETRHAARVRDLSMGGASLLVGRAFQPGQIVRLEMKASNDEVRTLLACIVRVNEDGLNQWSVGCVFSRELSEEDMKAFVVDPQPASPEDQRTWVRFTCDLKARFQRVGVADAPIHTAEVLNVSVSGIGFLTDQALEAGALLNLDLLNRQGEVARSILACVVHTTIRSNGEESVGCNFIRQLSEDELHLLL